jgi:hypothetical protein
LSTNICLKSRAIFRKIVVWTRVQTRLAQVQRESSFTPLTIIISRSCACITVIKTISAYIRVIPFVNRTATYQTLSIIVKIIRIITPLTISVIPFSTKRTFYIALPAFIESFISIISIWTSCIAKIIYQESCS